MLKRRHESEVAKALEVRLVPGRILTQAGWIVGKLHVPEGWRLVNHLNKVQEFFSLADVILEGRPKVVPLFTLHRSAIQFVVVESDEPLEPDLPPRNPVDHSVQCLLQNGTLYGRMQITRGVRLSDHLSKNSGFLLVRDAHFQLRNPWEERTIDHREPAVLLNPQAVVGVSEAAQDE